MVEAVFAILGQELVVVHPPISVQLVGFNEPESDFKRPRRDIRLKLRKLRNKAEFRHHVVFSSKCPYNLYGNRQEVSRESEN